MATAVWQRRANEVKRELAMDLGDSRAIRDISEYVAKVELERDVLQQAARNALEYLRNAMSEDFARGSDKAVRVELAAALGVEL